MKVSHYENPSTIKKLHLNTICITQEIHSHSEEDLKEGFSNSTTLMHLPLRQPQLHHMTS